MKKRILLFLILSIFINMSFVKAGCTKEEINELKQQADEIEITYEHMGKIETEEGTNYSKFKVEIENVPNEFYIIIDTIKNEPTNNRIITKLSTGERKIDIYSTKCEEKIDSIEFKLPRYNIYSEDSLCEGIEGNDFALCGKYYETYVSYDDFKTRVKNYRITHKIDKKISNEKNENITKNTKTLDNIKKFINEYKIHIVYGIIITIIIVITILLIEKRKKRGVLK